AAPATGTRATPPAPPGTPPPPRPRRTRTPAPTATDTWPAARRSLGRLERVQDGQVSWEVPNVARYERALVDPGGGGQQAGHAGQGGLGTEPAPLARPDDIDAHDAVAVGHQQLVQPLFVVRGALRMMAAQTVDPVLDLARDEDAQIQVVIVHRVDPPFDCVCRLPLSR